MRLTPSNLHLGLILLALCATPSAGAAALQSPWDAHPVTLTDRSYACPEPSHVSSDLTVSGYYKSGTHASVVDPEAKEENKEVTGPYRQVVEKIVDAADAYQTTGSRSAALCAASLIDAAAKDHFLAGSMHGKQSYFTQKWLVGGIAIAYLKTRPSNVVSSTQSAEILAWLKTVAAQSITFAEAPNEADGVEKRNRRPSLNNQRYWAGLEVAAVGIAANDQDLFKWGIGSAELGIGQIEEDGTLPLEMKRESHALSYHLFALSPLVMLAEFGAVNGEDLYSSHNHALSRLVNRAISGVNDPSYFRQKTGEEQNIPPWSAAGDYAWLRPYVRRFPNPALSATLAKVESLNALYLGGLPPQ
jgi:poly(beta-D-mannuronate) lyase